MPRFIVIFSLPIAALMLAYYLDIVGPSTSRDRIIYCEKDVIRFYEKYSDMHEESEIEIQQSRERLDFIGANNLDAFLKKYPSKDRQCFYE